MEKHYINLTNGIEALSLVKDKNYSFVRIQSTTIERHSWTKLFLDLDHDLLLHLAIGYTCYIYDFGTNRKVSKTCYIGVPLIKYILNRFWHNVKDKDIFRIARNGKITDNNLESYFNHVYEYLFVYDSNKEKEKVKTKLNYYKRYLNSDEVSILPVSNLTTNDGNYNYYRNQLITNLKT